jgi:hypothetical protein
MAIWQDCRSHIRWDVALVHLYIFVIKRHILGPTLCPDAKKFAHLRLGLFIAQCSGGGLFSGGPIVICIDRDQLVTRLAEIRARTKNSIELSRRMIDHSFLRFRTSQRNLYAVQRSLELLNTLPKTTDSAMYRELAPDPAKN